MHCLKGTDTTVAFQIVWGNWSRKYSIRANEYKERRSCEGKIKDEGMVGFKIRKADSAI